MAKKQKDFKPDPQGAGFLSRLYLTPRQRKTFGKWALYALVGIAVLVVQDCILSRVHLLGAATDLVPAVLLLVCVLEGPESGGMFALWGGLFYLLSGSAPTTASLLLVTALGIAAALFRERYLRRGFASTWLCAGAGMLLYELGVFLLGLLLGKTIGSRLGVFLLTGVLSGLVMPILYPLLRSVSKIGGESWKE